MDFNLRPTETDEASVRRTARPRRILLAEDGKVNQRFATGCLCSWGHEVVVVSDGQQAMDMIEREGFDLVLMDVQMPVMDGLAATAAVRSAEYGTTRRLPIIAMTASTRKGDRERCLEAGMDDYIVKPVDPDRLFEVVEAVPAVVLSGRAAEVASGALKPVTGDQESPEIIAPLSDAADSSASAPPVHDPQEPLIDWDSALRNMPGGKSFAQELADIFRTESPELLARLREGLDRQESQLVRRTAHKFKSSVAIFAATQVVEKAERLESLARDSDMGNQSKLAVDELAALTTRLVAELDDYFATR